MTIKNKEHSFTVTAITSQWNEIICRISLWFGCFSILQSQDYLRSKEHLHKVISAKCKIYSKCLSTRFLIVIPQIQFFLVRFYDIIWMFIYELREKNGIVILWFGICCLRINEMWRAFIIQHKIVDMAKHHRIKSKLIPLDIVVCSSMNCYYEKHYLPAKAHPFHNM